MANLSTLFATALHLAVLFLPIIVQAAVPASIQLLPGNIVKSILPPFGPDGRGQTGPISISKFNTLQLNLCNSGFAKCYHNGDSVPEGGELIWNTGPNTATFNEICSGDIAELQSYIGEAWPEDYTYSVFMPAIDKRTAAAYKCKNGFQYGSAVMGVLKGGKDTVVQGFGGKYVEQDGGNEQRIFVCAISGSDHMACTTHLTSTSEPLALSQCTALMTDAIPYLKNEAGYSGRVVVAGDLNLDYDPDDAENVQKCVPSRWTRKGDGDVQHTMYTNDLTVESTKAYGLSNTDHDGWLVQLKIA